MAVGTITETQRPRYQDNQRWDENDAQAESDLRLLREQMYTKTFIGAGLPFLSGSGETIGLVLQGGSITGQSSGTSLVTLGAELFAAIDADGLLITKSAATGSITVSCPIGTSTVYAYGVDTPDTLAQRAFMPAVAPFNEFFQGTNTRFTNKGGLIAISGDSTVNSTVINGVTRPLVAVALVSNSAGNTTIVKQYTNVLQTVRPLSLQLTSNTNFNITVTSTGGSTSWTYVVVARGRKGQVLKVSQAFVLGSGPATLNTSGTAQNSVTWTPLPEAQDYLVYRTASGGTPNTTGNITPTPIVVPPGMPGTVTFIDTGFAGDATTLPTSTTSPIVVPSSSTDRGAGGATPLTVVDQQRTIMSLLADIKFKGSLARAQANQQTAAADYGAYSTIRRGLDAVDRSTTAVWTIGDGVNTFGDFNYNDPAYLNGFSSPDFTLLLTDLFAAINAVSQVTLSDGRTVLNNKYKVIIKPGSYSFGNSITTPPNIIFEAEEGTSISVTQGASLGNFKLNTAGRVLLFLPPAWTLAEGCELRNLIVQGGAGEHIVLNGKNKIDNCTFYQSYGTVSIAGIDPVITATASPPTGGTSDIMITRSRFFYFNNSGSLLPNNFTNQEAVGISLSTVRDVLIEDCLFATDTNFTGYSSSQAPIPAAFVTLANVVENVVVRRCRFDMYDDLYSIGTNIVQAAMIIKAGVTAEANRSIIISECNFAQRNWRTGNLSASGTADYARAIEVDEEINIIVEKCIFVNTARGVSFIASPGSSHTYNHYATRVRDCTFTNNGIAGVFVDNQGVGIPTFKGMWIHDNTFTNCRRAVWMNSGTGQVNLTDLTIRRNKIFDATTAGYQGFVLQASFFTDIAIEENSANLLNDNFVRMTLFSAATPIGLGISINDNKLESVIRTGYTSGAVILLTTTSAGSGTWTGVEVKRNRMSNINVQTTAPTSAAETNIGIFGDKLSNIDISSNVILAVATGYTSGTRPYHIIVEPGFSTSGHFASYIRVCDNILGDSASQYEAVLFTKQVPGTATVFSRNIEISNNEFAANYAAGTAAQSVSWNLGDSGVGDKWANVDFSHNKTYIEAGGAAITMANDSWELRVGTCAGLEFIGNMWFVNTGTWTGSKGATLLAAGGIAASIKAVANTATNSAAGATGFTYSATLIGGYAAGNT